MAGEQTELDFDNMSDEDFLKISEQDAMAAVASQTPDPENEEDPNAEITPETDPNETGENVDGAQSHPDAGELGDAGNDSDPNAGEVSEENPDGTPNPGEGAPDPLAEAGEAVAEGDKPKEGEQSEADPKEKGKATPDTKKPSGQLPEGVTVEQATTALDFFTKITAPFKADGKDFSVRTPEDAIRLMQQGVNYSRRMHDLKPMKAMTRMLQDHGLNDQTKLSFLIDVSKGDKTAITKLLKDNNLDPMDLDISGETGYQAKSYAGNPQDNAFRDALDNTVATPEGQALVGEIHQTWDEASKARLREDPSILGNLMELKQSGHYSKIVDELDYQKGLGYLTHVPFLQAFDQVGQAMRNAGVLDPQPQPAPGANPMGQLHGNTQPQGQPVASGARKAPPAKKAQPNPHLSSTPPSSQTNQPSGEPDYGKMSDEDFLKMAPPS